jgi:hypothetical protein
VGRFKSAPFQAREVWGGDTALQFTVPRLPQGVSSGLVRMGPSLGLVSSTPFRVIAPVPTARLDPNIGPNTPIWAGSTRVSFFGHLHEITKVTFAGGVELTQGWTISLGPVSLNPNPRDRCFDRLEILVPPAAVSGPVTFTNSSRSVSVNLTISH